MTSEEKLKIIANICDYHLSLEWKSPNKYGSLPFERYVFFKLSKELTREPLAKIGSKCNRDHSTVMHGLKVFNNEILEKKSNKFWHLYLELFQKCRIAIKEELMEQSSFTGILITGDFSQNTMTFEIEGEMKLQAGKYEIKQIEVGSR